MLSKEDVTGMLASRLAELYDVKLEEITKSNYHYSALMLGEKNYDGDSHLYAAFDLNVIYDCYRQNGSIEKTLDYVVTSYENHKVYGLQGADFVRRMTKETIGSAIAERLIPYENNEEYLSGVIHKKYMDLAVVYEIKNGNSSVVITHQLAQHLGIAPDDIAKIAEQNRPSRHYEYKTMAQVMLEMMDAADMRDVVEDMFASDAPTTQMYVISNPERYHGAAALLDDTVLQQLSQEVEGDLLVIPSSIHELIVLKITEDTDYNAINEIIESVNANEVAPEERLGDHAYVYKKDEHLLQIAPAEDQQQHQTYPVNR